MDPQEKATLKKELVDEFVLIPKNRWYYLIGGAVAAVVVAFGIGIKSIFSYVGSQPAEQAKQRIAAILAEAESYRSQMLAGLARGTIVVWKGGAELPNGWVICDGENGTPDLRGRFILGADDAEKAGETGGSAKHMHTAKFSGSRFEADNIGSRGTGATRHDDNQIVVADASSMPPYMTLVYIMKQ